MPNFAPVGLCGAIKSWLDVVSQMFRAIFACKNRISMNYSMHRTFTLAFALLCSFVGALVGKAQVSPYMPKVKTVLTYNIRNATTDDGQVDFADVVATIQRADADFVALQELDSVTGRSKGKDVLRELALLSQYYPVYGSSINYDGGRYGLGILSKQKPVGVRKVALPGREEARTMLVAEFQDVVLACTHLSLTDEDRMASAGLILAEAEGSTKPFLLAGDFNAVPESDFIKQIERGFIVLSPKDKHTFPARSPKACIDYIASFKGSGESLVLREAEVMPRGRVSDHLPVLARFQLKTPVERILYGKPYLQNPSPEAISVMFQTRTIAHAWVEYGQDTLNLRRARMEYGGQAVCHDIEHRVRLEGLQPGGKYYYRVCAQEILHYAAYNKVLGDTQVTDFYSFQLPEDGQEDFTALIFNDLHRNQETIGLMSQLADSIPHDFVLFNGDCIPDPASREDAMHMLHRLASAFHAEEIPAFFVRGNHEIRNFHSAALPSLLEQPGGKTYGSFSWGDTRFVILDCGEDKPDDHPVYYGLNDFSAFRQQQCSFLQEEMKSREFRKAERRVLLSHIPLWGNGDKYQPCSELWTPLLENARFDVGLSGHTHRFRYYSAGDVSNPFPVCIGGGPGANSATMMVLTKKGEDFSLRVLNAKGQELGAWPL